MKHPKSAEIRKISDLKSFTKYFVKQIDVMKKSSLSNHLIVPFGDDFAFYHGTDYFSTIDELIQMLKEDYGIIAKYSTPSIFLNDVTSFSSSLNSNKQIQEVTKFSSGSGDFFPYADDLYGEW